MSNVNVNLYVDNTPKEGPTREDFLGHTSFPARPVVNDTLEYGGKFLWVYRVAMRAGDDHLRVFCKGEGVVGPRPPYDPFELRPSRER